ncbi:hypothetical protein KO507_19185 [Gilvimarinus agarilyticus]|uniref:hypothetical protein n=1 Tax=Reichenbachiella agariperforans TaxID=156994 RepID=UPI001C08CE2B|nr:hypothetical protein [Reichenbachiella agariperforans]MBU2887897.1 hypothetical protein [Gilvimarinus agarilyticus]MBU2912739.1 hypothetical protein [Reichenbachiella agariperforans]
MFSKEENYSLFDPSVSLREEVAEGTFAPKFSFDESIEHIKFSIDKVKILKKKEFLTKAEVYVAWIVADDTSDEPIQIGKTGIFENVKKNDELTLGPAGLTIYRSQSGKLPKYIRYSLLVIESDQGVREFGEAMEKVRSSDEFKAITKSIIATTALAAPQVALVTEGINFALKMIAKTMSMNKDDQMILIEGSYDRLFDDLGVVYNTVKKNSRYAEVHYSVKAV